MKDFEQQQQQLSSEFVSIELINLCESFIQLRSYVSLRCVAASASDDTFVVVDASLKKN